MRALGPIGRILGAFLCGVLAAAALPPIHALPALLAFAVLLLLVRRTPSRAGAFLVGWAFGFGWFLAGLYWVGIAFYADAERFGSLAVPAVLLLAAFLAILPGLACLAVTWRSWISVRAQALALAVASRRATWLALAAGIALYLLYIVRIGGDFMSGRFLTAPLFVAVAVVMMLLDGRLRTRRRQWGAAAVVAALALAGYGPLWLAGNPVGDDARRDGDIADERAYYWPNTGLMNPARTPHPWATQGLELRAQGPAVIEHGNVGFLGYFAGPDIHIVDRNGLTDPLLARLPVRDPAGWRIGHFRRNVPDGYIDTLRGGRNVIADPAIAAYYDTLTTITRGPLWSAERRRAIWQVNTE